MTPAEKVQSDQAFGIAWRTPEVQATNMVHSEIKNAMMIKIDPAGAELNQRLAAADAAGRKVFDNQEKVAERKEESKS